MRFVTMGRESLFLENFTEMARKLKSEKDMVSSGAGPAAAVPRRKALVTRTKHANTQAETSLTPVAESSVADSTTPVIAMSETTAAPAAQPSYEEISLLAYSYWEARGCQGGSPDEDWRRAEEELRARTQAATA
jgi:hypothetical protein